RTTPHGIPKYWLWGSRVSRASLEDDLARARARETADRNAHVIRRAAARSARPVLLGAGVHRGSRAVPDHRLRTAHGRARLERDDHGTGVGLTVGGPPPHIVAARHRQLLRARTDVHGAVLRALVGELDGQFRQH